MNFFPVLKTGDPKGFQSSNLCASARLNKGLPKGSPFVFRDVRIHLEYFPCFFNGRQKKSRRSGRFSGLDETLKQQLFNVLTVRQNRMCCYSRAIHRIQNTIPACGIAFPVFCHPRVSLVPGKFDNRAETGLPVSQIVRAFQKPQV